MILFGGLALIYALKEDMSPSKIYFFRVTNISMPVGDIVIYPDWFKKPKIGVSVDDLKYLICTCNLPRAPILTKIEFLFPTW